MCRQLKRRQLAIAGDRWGSAARFLEFWYKTSVPFDHTCLSLTSILGRPESVLPEPYFALLSVLLSCHVFLLLFFSRSAREFFFTPHPSSNYVCTLNITGLGQLSSQVLLICHAQAQRHRNTTEMASLPVDPGRRKQVLKVIVFSLLLDLVCSFVPCFFHSGRFAPMFSAPVIPLGCLAVANGF